MLRNLYGGAITCVIPSEFCDISKVREVPDHQECFAHQETDRSIIVEILEHLKDQTDSTAAQYYFKDLADANGSQDTKIEEVKLLQPSDHKNSSLDGNVVCGLVGNQVVSKFRESSEAANDVKIYLAVIRLPQYDSDILITMNVPIKISPTSSSSTAVDPECVFKGSGDLPGMATFTELLKTFSIVNPALFG
mmetsp:Transcript_6132/g.7021  ORF Transcript_6132/g.7021 Transcript_6132/m.7021 type:complete len:192 (+) Transcript_6132:137-712(+)